jgi:integrase
LRGALKIEHQELFKNLFIAQIMRPAVGGEDGGIKLGQATIERLANHRDKQSLIKEAQRGSWVENELIFPNMLGKPMACENMYVEFKKFLKENDLPDIRFHDLRHTSISFLLDMGTPINTFQQRAGHSKASVTTDTYGHSMAHSQDEAAERLEELLTPVAVDVKMRPSKRNPLYVAVELG